MRRLVPRWLVAVCVLASLLATAPWLRAFPVSVGAVPLLGAAVLSVLLPVVTVRLGVRLLLGALIDIAVLLVYTLVVVLHEPFGFAALVDGFYHGPSRILTFALPLVSPRSLLVAPVALSWLAGALAGECVARRWAPVLPYFGLLVTFGLAYAGTKRAAGPNTPAGLREPLLAAGLLATLLLLRAGQAWLRQDETADSTQPDGALPMRGFAVGVVTALIVAGTAFLVVQTGAFPKRAAAPQRVPSIDDSHPLGPVSFVAGLRPRSSKNDAQPVFTVTLDRDAPGYFGIANVDFYDGAGWSFERTFRPSGGVLPADADVALRTSGPSVVQVYRVDAGPLSSAPWMPALYRPTKVTGRTVDIDRGSGMIVPATALSGGARYTVESAVAQRMFSQLMAAQATPDTATSTNDSQIPGTLRTTLDRLVAQFAAETGVPSTPVLPFLQALQHDLRTRYALSGAARGSATGTQSAAPSPSARSGSRTSPSRPTASASPTGPSADRAGGTSFADVLASVLGQRSGTPEQFATLTALVARSLGVPARVVTGFRATNRSGAEIVRAGTHTVDTSEAWTWAEIPIVGQGWVVLDAAPGQYAPNAQQPEPAAASSPKSSRPPSQNALITSASGGHAIAKKSDVPDANASSKQGLLVALLVVTGVLALALLLILASRKRVRARRRRRATDPRTQLLGAWQESIDVLTEAGLPGLSALTSAEIAELAAAQFGTTPGEQAAALGQSANAAAYSAVTVVQPADVDDAWATHDQLRRSVFGQLGFRARARAALRYNRRSGGPLGRAPMAAATSSRTPERTARHRGRRRR